MSDTIRQSTQGSNTVRVEGELDADNVPTRLRQSADWFGRDRETIIDLDGVTHSDSAGVALLLEWTRDAQTAQGTLSFINAPPQIRAIIDFCGLNDVIPVADTAH